MDMKRNIVLLLLITIFFSFPIDVKASSSKVITVFVDEKKIHFDVNPYKVEGTTLVQFRPIFEALGMAVEWNKNTKTIIGTKEGLKIKLSIDDAVAFVNEKKIFLNLPPKIVNGYTFVPVRFISEASGAIVNWHPESNTIKIYRSELEYAIIENDLELAKNSLLSGSDPNKEFSDGNTPLYLAVMYSNAEFVKLLLDAGADPNQESNSSYLPLHEAIRNGDSDIVNLLLERGANPEIEDSLGLNALEVIDVVIYPEHSNYNDFIKIKNLINEYSESNGSNITKVIYNELKKKSIKIEGFPYSFNDQDTNTNITLNQIYQTDIGVLLDITIKNESRSERLLDMPFEEYELIINEQKLKYINDSRETKTTYQRFYGLGINNYQVLFDAPKGTSVNENFGVVKKSAV